jgi:hypothetical protein
MTDVQVSNARRIGFTALALVTFWVLAWNAYWFLYLGCRGSYFHRLWFTPAFDVPICVAFALAPMMLYSFATRGFIRLRHRGELFVGGLFATSIGLSLSLGLSDATAAINMARDHNDSTALLLEIAAARSDHTVSWFSLLLPIILTTAFVIFGAWRRAVRDAEVEVVGEDE